MFLISALLYPAVLALECLGAGCLIDRLSGRFLSPALLPAVGAAVLIAVSQLSTYLPWAAPATPYLIVLVGVAGLVVGRSQLAALARRRRVLALAAAVPVSVYLLALLPALLAGRATFSSYMALADSAVHMIGADFLVHHGAEFGHLDLHNSYGQFLDRYYNTSYPSGADTLFGGSALLLGVPLIWAFQPFNAFMLATASGPAWVLARKLGLDARWAALAALSASVPALVYAYELLGSIKEITALPMILALGALVASYRRWLAGGVAAGIPFALLAAAGISALGVGFAAWVLASALVLLAVAVAEMRARRLGAGRAFALFAGVLAVVLVATLPTWVELPQSVHVAHNIATTSNPGNLHRPLRWMQLLGSWLRGSYKQSPSGTAQAVTFGLITLTLGCIALGVVHLLRTRRYALAGWFALMLAVLALVSAYATTWVSAKTLMLSSPVVVLIAWAGVAELKGLPLGRAARVLAGTVAFVLLAGMVASDLYQYHSANLAPTRRYEELASVDRRFAGQGPALFSDFDEYALYQLRDLDVGGPDFVYPPAALSTLAGGYGMPVLLDRAPPAALRGYPLIITRRDPTASPPPVAYGLAWQGRYYEVWRRAPRASTALLHLGAGGTALTCSRLRRFARRAARAGASLIGAVAPQVLAIALARASHPRRWGHERGWLVMATPGRLSASFTVPHAGGWKLWLKGQIMPAIAVSVDGQRVGRVSGELAGNSLVANTAPPLTLTLSAGTHRLTIIRGGFTLAPGDGGSAVLAAVLITPADAPARVLASVEVHAGAGALCRRRYLWVEALPSRRS